MKTLVASVLLGVALVSTGVRAFEMQVVARLPFWAARRFVCGDADHNGRREVYLNDSDRGCFALEHIGRNEFDTVPVLPQTLRHLDLGDGDLDGKSDLLCQPIAPSRYLMVVEAPDQHSLPDSVVWCDTMPTVEALHGVFMDLDMDGLPELTRSLGHPVYETGGDNRYCLRGYLNPRPPGSYLDLVHPTGDLDRDGLADVAGCGAAWVYLFEAAGNDSFACVAACSLPSAGELYISDVVATGDMDQDGYMDLAVLGYEEHGPGRAWVLESTKNDSIESVWDTQFSRGGYGTNYLAAGDVDGDSVREFALTDGRYVRLFRCTGNNQYEEVWQATTGHEPVALYDINSDGRAELMYGEPYESVVCAYVDSSGIAEREAARLRGVEVSPSVLRPGARLRLSGLPPDAKVELLDVSGRVCFESGSAFILPPSSLNAGAYFVRITSGSQSVTRKVLVVE